MLAPPATAAGPATVSVTAEGVARSTQPAVASEDPLTGTGGGAGGCPADVNLLVRVVDEEGLPLAGANVMVGLSESPAHRRRIFLDGDDSEGSTGAGAGGAAATHAFHAARRHDQEIAWRGQFGRNLSTAHSLVG